MANGPDGGEACETLDSHPSPFTPLDANYITETAQIGEGSSIIAPRERSTVSKRPAKERHDRASLAEWHSARHELLSARLACETEEDSDSERTPTKKANRGKAKITPNRGGIQEEDLEREKSLKALLKGRPAKITSDFEAEKVVTSTAWKKMQTVMFNPLIRTYHRTVDIRLLRMITHRTRGNGPMSRSTVKTSSITVSSRCFVHVQVRSLVALTLRKRTHHRQSHLTESS